MWRMCQYLHEESAWQRWSFILMEVFKKNKWSMVVPVKVEYAPGHLTDVRNEGLFHSAAFVTDDGFDLTCSPKYS